MTDNTDALPPLPASQAFSLTRSVYTADDMHAYARAALASRDAEIAKLRQGEPVAWVPVAERMPKSGVTVLACYTNRYGNVRRIRAEWVAAKTIESDGDCEIGEYDEATDCCYDPEGWYEKIDNWDDYSSVVVNEGEVTHWMALPAPPDASPPPAQPATVDCEHWNGRFCGKSGACYRPSCIPRATTAAQPAQPACACNDALRLYAYAGGADDAGLYGRLWVNVEGENVEYVRRTTEAQPPQVEPVAWPFDVTLDQAACELLFKLMHPALPGSEEYCEVRLQFGPGHSGHGLYVSQAEYPEEGSLLLTASPPPAQPPQAEFHNPWRTSLENCISGDNYLRASEYRDLIEELDELYRLRAAQPPREPVQPLSADDLWNSKEVMSVNAEAGLQMTVLMKLVRAIERLITERMGAGGTK